MAFQVKYCSIHLRCRCSSSKSGSGHGMTSKPGHFFRGSSGIAQELGAAPHWGRIRQLACRPPEAMKGPKHFYF